MVPGERDRLLVKEGLSYWVCKKKIPKSKRLQKMNYFKRKQTKLEKHFLTLFNV